MTKPRKKQGNPDFRHQVTSPAPTSEEIESRLIELVTPGTFANLKGVKDKERSLRDAFGGQSLRVLTLPVMAAIVLSLLYRQIHYLTDVLRCLEVEGLLWVEAMSVSRQALSQRLESLPTDRRIHNYSSFLGWLSINVLWVKSKLLVNDTDATPPGRLTFGLQL
ncbi:hypothetical protein IQ276_008410 [Desmonostoc muscorum LEGE 12446]|nr:hypothetical protein [Desmonostoc muscorum LEGE 12446]